MIRWHDRAITPQTRQAMEKLETLPWLKDFYLAGGTALALQMGHRLSVDLDFFSSRNSLASSQREAIKKSLQAAGKISITGEEEGTLHVLFYETAISFLRYDYPLLKPLLFYGKIKIASIEDIALMKMGAIVGRGAKKDFLDVYTLCKQIPLASLFEMSAKKFPHYRDFAIQAARALVYFADAETQESPRLLKPCRWEEAKRFFEKETPSAIKKILRE